MQSRMEVTKPVHRPRERGAALILVLALLIGLLAFTAVSVDMTRARAVSNTSEERLFAARQIAESALAQATGRLKEGGQEEPVSGDGMTPVWVPFDQGEYFFSSVHDEVTSVTTIRCWARVPVGVQPSNSAVSPDDLTWDGTGYLVQGLEAEFKAYRYMPEAPVYFGNGGFEKPLGGFAWTNSVDPFDPTTWSTVTSGESSYQDSSVPFMVNALDHPIDYLYNGGTPSPASGIHPYSLVASQNPISQMNTEAWFKNSAGTGDPLSNVFPTVSSTYFSSDPASPDYAFPVNPDLPDVQDYSWTLWNEHRSTSKTSVKYTGGDHIGEYGTLAAPEVTFVTGHLNIPASKTLRGCGILVIRDDFDPSIDTNNTPAQAAKLTVGGTLEWTGLVIIAGWDPSITVSPGGSATIVGSLMAEDSVMSGGEVSLDGSTIQVVAKERLELRYCSQLFQPGGYLHDFLPMLKQELLTVRDIYPPVS